jgi:chromosome segregation ATPase
MTPESCDRIPFNQISKHFPRSDRKGQQKRYSHSKVFGHRGRSHQENIMPTKSNKTVAKSGFSAKPQPRPEADSETVAESAAAKADDQSTTIDDLKSKLAAAITQGDALQQTIADLESKLAAQTKTVETLKTEAKAFTSLKTTLEKAEAAARQLAALNNTLIEENSNLKAAASQPAAIAPTAPEKKSTALAAPKPQYNSMMHSVFPNDPLPGGLAEQEIGWFD